MRSICFYSSYFTQNKVPYYVKCYLSELARHFDEVVLITNNKALDETNFFQDKINLLMVANEGFDFGMWYNAIKKYDINTYDRVGLMNDSCILFKRLDEVFNKINNNNWDYCGILNSKQIAYHVQSYFVVINKPAIQLVESYFLKHGILKDIDDVIRVYEVGLTQHLMQSNLKVGTVFACETCENLLNPSFSEIENLIRSGFPMIKKKIIFGNYRRDEPLALSRTTFNFNAKFYIKLIKNSRENLILDFDALKNDYNYKSANFKLYRIIVFSKVFNLLRRLIH